jgi:hypothetical protein
MTSDVLTKDFRFLTEFQALFKGRPYKHRSSTHGDWVSQFVFENLFHLKLSSKFNFRVEQGRSVLNSTNRAHGVKHRRGDGSLGTLIPGDQAVGDPGFAVERGPIANIEVGTEVKILAKAMIKQIDRVKSDLRKQATEFRRSNPRAITAAIIGVNHASRYRSFEGEREFVTDGKRYAHPATEAAAALRHIEELRSDFDELLVLRFEATNLEPYPFEWVNSTMCRKDYASFLVRIGGLYEHRF